MSWFLGSCVTCLPTARSEECQSLSPSTRSCEACILLAVTNDIVTVPSTENSVMGSPGYLIHRYFWIDNRDDDVDRALLVQPVFFKLVYGLSLFVGCFGQAMKRIRSLRGYDLATIMSRMHSCTAVTLFRSTGPVSRNFLISVRLIKPRSCAVVGFHSNLFRMSCSRA